MRTVEKLHDVGVMLGYVPVHDDLLNAGSSLGTAGAKRVGTDEARGRRRSRGGGRRCAEGGARLMKAVQTAIARRVREARDARSAHQAARHDR